MKVTDDFKLICTERDNYPQLIHASNIITKCSDKMEQKQEEALQLIIPRYADYLREMLSLTGCDRTTVGLKVMHLNKYYNFLHEGRLDGAFSAQGKFRSTILEEFLFLLFKDYVKKLQDDNNAAKLLDSGSVKAYTNIYFKAKNFQDFIKSPEIGVNEKDQDYAIYRNFDITINDATSMVVRIPAVAVEAKTYIDKTMLDSIIATAEKIKTGNPHTRFIAVAERYDVSFSVDPAYSRIDQIYILRKSMRKNQWMDIDENVVWRMVDETIGHLQRPWSDIETRLKEDGVII